MQENPELSRPRLPARFGIFEVNFARSELRKHGLRIKLQEKPFQILVALLERPGEVVTREELRAKLWGPGTYVDFERSLNIAINKLRAGLGDDSQSPRFIETVPRRGYRFIAPVAIAAEPAAVPAADPAPAATASGAPLRAPRLTALTAGVATAIAFAVAAWAFWPDPSPQVAGFVQLTADGEGKQGPLLSDGVNLIFQSSATLGLRQVSLKGGQAAPLRTDLGQRGLLDYSPRRAALLVKEGGGTGEEDPLWEIPLPAGSPRPLGHLKAYSAAWSPDGERVAISTRGILKTARSDGSAEKELGAFPGRVLHPRWSPDGRRISFVVADETKGLQSLWEIGDEGANPRVLLEGDSSAEGDLIGHWLPDGRSFVFARFQDGRSDLWVLQEKSSWRGAAKPRLGRLTPGQMDMLYPISSADGRQLYAVGKHSHDELVRYDSRSRQFLPYMQGVSAAQLSFSRDAQRVAYILFPEHTLWCSRADGSERRQLTFPPLEVLLPAWSPDGKTIAFMARVAGKPWKIASVPAAGGTPETMLPGERNEGHPSWSADGASMIFAGAPWEQSFAPGSTRIQQVDLRTQKVTTLPDSEGLWSPRRSPDGRFLVAEGLDSRTLMLFDFAGQKWKRLAQLSGGPIGYTSWSHDSKWIFFNTLSDKDPAIYRVAVKDGRMERVFDLAGVRMANTLSQWFALAPDDAPLLLRNTSLQEIYAMTLRMR